MQSCSFRIVDALNSGNSHYFNNFKEFITTLKR